MKYKLIAIAVLALVLVGLYVATDSSASAPPSTDSSGSVLHP
jgi:hypothetical protein